MRVVVVVAAMLFCAPVFAQGVKLPSVTNSIGMELIEIPAGKFTMGDGAGVAVTLTQSFELGKYEVTQSEYMQVMTSQKWSGKANDKVGEEFPATFVSWEDATEFCKKLTAIEHKNDKLPAGESYRLPTEAEWEYACRAGTTTAFSFGDDESELGDYAWWSRHVDLYKMKRLNDVNVALLGLTVSPGNAGRDKYAHKVGLKKPNPWGLYDMHGNVNEWCSDWYDGKLSDGVDPVGPKLGSDRVNRGGNWRRSPSACRSARRSGHDPSDRINNLGFRVARSQLVQQQ